ncbi:MAG: gluconate 2-dehydrogenase subunit 3 family protein [Gammaproteobacteria bacterium]|nr:gluconate 2-dehydrogenase subunit 3 family protein [Gammaproteobacteria bacterium]
MPERYPGYDVLAKRATPSWNEPTRRVIDARLSIPNEPRFFTMQEWETLTAICDRIVPQPKDRAPVPIAALVDRKMTNDERDGYRQASMPKMQQAWQRGLAALDAAARASHGAPFHAIAAVKQDVLLKAMQNGELSGPEWNGMPAHTFFSERLAHDILAAYYSHSSSWNEIGFGGPASPRGYVRMNFNRRDSWEAVEAKPGHEAAARKANERVG